MIFRSPGAINKREFKDGHNVSDTVAGVTTTVCLYAKWLVFLCDTTKDMAQLKGFALEKLL